MKPKSSLFVGILLLSLTQNTLIVRGISQADNQKNIKVSVSNVDSLPRKSKRYALIVGVNEYQDAQISKLEGAANDAKSFAETLIQFGGFPADQVFTFTTGQAPDRQPTRGNILSCLSRLHSIVPEDGLLLIFFSGHGIERNGKGYLLPADAQANGDLELLEQTAINAEVVKKWVHDTGISQILLIIDACRSNPSAGRGDTAKTLTDNYANKFNFDLRNKEIKAFATLYATEVGQVAYEQKDKKQGYFTTALIEGMKGAAADENGEVVLTKLVKYIQDTVPKRVRLELGDEKKQKPFAIIEGYKADDLVIAVTGKVQIATPTSASTAQTVDTFAIELSFWDTIKNSSNPEDFFEYIPRLLKSNFS